jgi:hypothetical protein
MVRGAQTAPPPLWRRGIELGILSLCSKRTIRDPCVVHLKSQVRRPIQKALDVPIHVEVGFGNNTELRDECEVNPVLD